MKKLLSIQYFQIIALLDVANQTTVAQESPKTTFSGNADFYYRFDFANAGEGITNNVTSFTNSNDSFELGMASIKATHKEGKASVFADLGFGNRAKEFSYNENTVTYDL
jgi:Putative beta-barrel porin-2, OmpL-like. bbp2